MFLSLLLHYCLPPPGAFSDPIFLLLKFSYHRYPTCLCLCCLHICALHSKKFFPPHPLQPRGPVFNPLKVSSPALGTPSLKKGFRRRQHGACGSFPARGFSERIWSLEPLGSRVEGWQGLYLLDLEAPTPQLGLNLLFQPYQQRDIHLLPTLCPCHPWSLDILLPF